MFNDCSWDAIDKKVEAFGHKNELVISTTDNKGFKIHKHVIKSVSKFISIISKYTEIENSIDVLGVFHLLIS